VIEIVQICRPISSYDSPVTLDHLKYIKDRLIGTLGSSEVTDKLGNLALGLCDTAQMLEPMKWVEGEELGDSHADPDWPDKNIIPLIGGNKFVFSGKQISPMPVQKYIIENALLGDNSAGVCVDDMYRDIENYPTTSKEVTDVGGEDKMEKGARREGKTAWDVAEQYIAIAEHEAYEVLKLVRPDHLVRATDYIQQQIDFARGLDEKGFLYKIDGDGMYFDTSRLPDYGKLARLDVAGLEAGARVSVEGKRNITDFAVWKFSPTDAKRDMEWNSPWGVGFPGWHLECSTIAREMLGDTIDIHTGGIDHIPVHHTNEIAQSESLTGQQFAQIWLHNNHIKVDGRKMSKSLGNIITLSDITARGFSPMAFKLAILSKHYQTEGNFTWEILEAAQARLDHWRGYAALRHQTHDTLDDDDEKDEQEGTVSLLAARQALIEKLNDDLDTPGAMALIDEAFSRLDHAPIEKIHRGGLLQLIEIIDEVLGLDLAESTPDITDDLKRLVIQRRSARAEKDWQESDRIRDELLAAGITIRDTPSGSIWAWK
jgi:cysteinyl-tRNA synthetase